jgi:SAM-dependent methyltransferase
MTVTVRRYTQFYRDLRSYFGLPGAEPFDIRWMIPLIHDKYSDAGDTGQYFYQDIWAMKRIMETKTSSHVDVGSRMILVGMMSAITRVTFVDVRPLQCNLPNLESRIGDITNMPYPDSSIPSLSCLHVAEHIGLGRYGDKLDPKGTEKAAAELVRVLAPSGNLFFSVPVGNPERVYFNSHRMYSVSTIMAMFSDLELVEASGIDGENNFIENIDVRLFDEVKHRWGGVCLLWLRKPAEVGRSDG